MIISLCVACREEVGRGQVRDAERKKDNQWQRVQEGIDHLRAREKGGLKGRGTDGNRASL